MAQYSPEIAERVFIRIAQLEARDRQRRRKRLKTAGTAAVCVLFTAAIAGLVTGAGGKIAAKEAAASVTMLRSEVAGAYVLAGVIGFSLGAAVILICMKRRARHRALMNKKAYDIRNEKNK